MTCDNAGDLRGISPTQLRAIDAVRSRELAELAVLREQVRLLTIREGQLLLQLRGVPKGVTT